MRDVIITGNQVLDDVGIYMESGERYKQASNEEIDHPVRSKHLKHRSGVIGLSLRDR